MKFKKGSLGEWLLKQSRRVIADQAAHPLGAIKVDIYRKLLGLIIAGEEHDDLIELEVISPMGKKIIQSVGAAEEWLLSLDDAAYAPGFQNAQLPDLMVKGLYRNAEILLFG